VPDCKIVGVPNHSKPAPKTVAGIGFAVGGNNSPTSSRKAPHGAFSLFTKFIFFNVL
jgi:hypothetical protein